MFPSIDADRLSRRAANKQYTLVLSQITPEDRQRVMALGLPGVEAPVAKRRVYPQGDWPPMWWAIRFRGAAGQTVLKKAIDEARLSSDDGPLSLSLDVVAQQVLEDELGHAMQRHDAKAAWGVTDGCADGGGTCPCQSS